MPYINETSKGPIHGSKVKALVEDGAEIIAINSPNGTVPPFEPNMVVVVDSGSHEAAGYAYDIREYERFIRPDGRNKTYLIYDKAKKFAK